MQKILNRSFQQQHIDETFDCGEPQWETHFIYFAPGSESVIYFCHDVIYWWSYCENEQFGLLTGRSSTLNLLSNFCLVQITYFF